MAKKSKKSQAPMSAEQVAALLPTHDMSGAPIHAEPTAEDVAAYEAELAADVGELTDEQVQELIGIAEGTSEPVAPEEPQAPSEEPQAAKDESYEDLAGKVLNDTGLIAEARSEVAAGFDEREAFEKAKKSGDSIFTTLNKTRAKLIQDKAVAALIVAGASTSFMTARQHEGSAYNVYAIDKVADLVNALSTGTIGNAINRSVMVSMFRFRAAGETFTGEMARACVSDKLRVQGQIAKLLMRHTVSPSTAPTQASSTMQALQTLGVVRNTGTTRAPAYVLTDSPVTKRLEAICAPLAA